MQKWLFTIKCAWDQKWPFATFFLALCSTLDFIFGRVLPHRIDDAIPRGIDLIPWYWWIIIWLAFFSLMMIDYATKQRLLVNQKNKEIEELKKPKEDPTELGALRQYIADKIALTETWRSNSSLDDIKIVGWIQKISGGINEMFGPTITNEDIYFIQKMIDGELDHFKNLTVSNEIMEGVVKRCVGCLHLLRSTVQNSHAFSPSFKIKNLKDF